MVRECYHPSDRNYLRVGGSGIRVHHPWRVSFDNFLADMGQPPDNGVLRRKDIHRDFTPDNCYWGS